jgi:predicted TIM-barrel fold metal-dependent hydrolase
MANRPPARSAILPTVPLLITESKDDFKRIRDALADEIKPRGILEQMYVEDIAYLVWEVLRLRRSRAGIINVAFREALESVLEQCLREPDRYVGQEADKLAHEWFTDPSAKKEVAELLRSFELDETAIEGEAIRKSADDLERIDRLMASAEARRDKALVCIAQYRGDFGALLRDNSNRLVGEKVLQLENAASKQQKSAA